MNQTTTRAWQAYEAGKEYKQNIGLYETVRRNERFYRGDQWYDSQTELPRPVFNLVRRITDYLVCSVIPGDISIHYTDDKLPFLQSPEMRKRVTHGLEILDRNAAYRWQRDEMQAMMHQALLNAAISGDGIFYCWWDDSERDGQLYHGDVHTELIGNANLFVADVNRADLQSQEYILLSGRASVSSLRREAIAAGVDPAQVEKILPDNNDEPTTSERSKIELSGNEKATYLLHFFRENGEVIFEKSTRDCVIKRVSTGLRLYPVAYFNWSPAKGSFHGSAPVSDMIANQRYVNTAYSMVMKHMYDTAFSKVIYDKSRIPEWSNTVGEAIAAVGGGNVSDAATVLGVGKLQDGYLDLIGNVIENTKMMMGATDAALGDAEANNTSALMLLQQASKQSLRQVESAFCRCIGELASIWADMLCTYCPKDRLLAAINGDKILAQAPDYQLLKGELLRANAVIASTTPYTPASTVALLDKLLDKGHISPVQYVKLLPNGSLEGRELLIEALEQNESTQNDRKEAGTNE